MDEAWLILYLTIRSILLVITEKSHCSGPPDLQYDINAKNVISKLKFKLRIDRFIVSSSQ